MDDTEKITILNGIGPGSTPQDPLALVAKMSESERSAMESDGRVGLANSAEPNTTPLDIRYGTSIQQNSLFETSQLLREVYYQLYSDGYEMPSKVANNPEEPSIGRIRADSIPPPHSPMSIKLCISRVERNPGIVNYDLFEDTTCDTPLTEGHISILHTDGPGLSPNEPMAIVQLQVKIPSILDGSYLIKNRAAEIYWCTGFNPIKEVYFYSTTMEIAKDDIAMQVNEHSPITILLSRG